MSASSVQQIQTPFTDSAWEVIPNGPSGRGNPFIRNLTNLMRAIERQNQENQKRIYSMEEALKKLRSSIGAREHSHECSLEWLMCKCGCCPNRSPPQSPATA